MLELFQAVLSIWLKIICHLITVAEKQEKIREVKQENASQKIHVKNKEKLLGLYTIYIHIIISPL